MKRPRASRVLRAAHHQLAREHTIDLELDSPEQLLGGNGEGVSGVDLLVGTLDSALRLPPTLGVRITVHEEGGLGEPELDAFRAYCQGQASDSWREAMTLRQGGIRELPRALILSLGAAAIGVVSGYLAQGTDSSMLMVILYAVAFVCVIAAWTIGWTPIEQALFDWRALGHTAAVYELLSGASVDFRTRPREPEPSRWP